MNLPLKISTRYFFSKKRGGGLSLITIISAISLLGYVVGAAALVIVLSVFNGFEHLFSSMYNRFDCDLKIVSTTGKSIDSLQFNWSALSHQNIAAFSPVVEENVLLRYDNKQSIATIKGVNNQYALISGIDSAIVQGVVDIRNSEDFALVGEGIAYRLGVNPNYPFKALAIYAPVAKSEPGLVTPEQAFNKALLMPSAVFKVQEEVDDKYVICSINTARELLNNTTKTSAVDIKLTNPLEMDETKQQLQHVLGEKYRIKNRFEQRDAFFKIMKSEKTISYFILLFILLIAATNSISSLYILSMEKKRDLFVLNSMGLSAKLGAQVFVYHGFLLAITGGVAGVIIGVGVCWLQQTYGLVALQETSDAMLSTYPIKVITKDVCIVLITVIAMGGLTTIYPAKKAKELMTIS